MKFFAFLIAITFSTAYAHEFAADSARGYAHVIPIMDGYVMVAFDRFDRENLVDGSIDDLFLLQINETDEVPHATTSLDAILLQKNDNIGIQMEDLDLGFVIRLNKQEKKRAQFQKPMDHIFEINAYGLIRVPAEGMTISELHDRFVDHFHENPDLDLVSNAGGSSCSATCRKRNCTANCQTGYSASCKCNFWGNGVCVCTPGTGGDGEEGPAPN